MKKNPNPSPQRVRYAEIHKGQRFIKRGIIWERWHAGLAQQVRYIGTGINSIETFKPGTMVQRVTKKK